MRMMRARRKMGVVTRSRKKVCYAGFYFWPPCFPAFHANYTLWSWERPTDSKQKSLPLRSARLSSLLPIKSFLSPNSRLTAKTPKLLQPPKTF